MTNIDLYQSIKEKEEQEGGSATGGFIDKGTITSVIIIILFFLGLAGSRVYKSYLIEQVAVANAELTKLNTSSGGENLIKVNDVQNRIALINDFLKTDKLVSPINVFKIVEGDIIPGAYLTALSYNSAAKTLNMSGYAGGFEDLAKQVLVVKKSQNYQTVVISDKTKKEKENKILFDFNLTLK